MREPMQDLVKRYQQSLYAVAFNICKNQMDAEDIVQEAFVQYYTTKKDFDDEQHIRAWLIRIVINKAKNYNLTFWRRNKCSLDDYVETASLSQADIHNPFFRLAHDRITASQFIRILYTLQTKQRPVAVFLHAGRCFSI